MNYFVCVKQVPDTTSRVSIRPDGTLDRSRMRTVTNPDDLRAMEAALRLRERFGGTVTAVTMGPSQAEEMLRELLAMGADDAVLVTGRAFAGSDTYATSRILAAALRTVGFASSDLILCGQQAIDGDTAQVGPQIAERLSIPQITYAAAIESDGETLTVKSLLEDGYRTVRAKAPCLIACMKELAEPRYLPVSGIFSAYEKPLTILDLDDLQGESRIHASEVGLAGSPTNCLATFPPKKRNRGTILGGADRKTAETLAELLVSKHLL